MVRSRSGSLYTGISTDVERRFAEHCRGQGARALRGRGPLHLVFSEHVGNQSQATRIEITIKKLPKAAKEQLVSGSLSLNALLAGEL